MEVRQSNIAAINLYEKLGFKNLGIRKNFYEFPKEHAVIMTLYFDLNKQKGMIFLDILGVESSCDYTAAAILIDRREIINFKASSQIDKHKIFGGVVPEVASRNHIESISALIETVMQESGKKFSDLDALAVTYAPGLVGSLLVGVNFVKRLAISTGLPSIPLHPLTAPTQNLTSPNLHK